MVFVILLDLELRVVPVLELSIVIVQALFLGHVLRVVVVVWIAGYLIWCTNS